MIIRTGAFAPTAPCLRAHHKLGRFSKKTMRWPRLSMTGKQGRKSFYKGTGQMPGLGRKSAGTWDAHGRYRLQEHKLRTFVIPKPPFDEGLRPYVAKSTIMTEAVKRQWPSRYKVTEQTADGQHIIRDLPFDHKVDGHFLLQLSDHFAGIKLLDPTGQQARQTQIDRELSESKDKPAPSDDPSLSPAELAVLDPHIETPYEVMIGERRRRDQRKKVAADLEEEALRPNRDAALSEQDGIEWQHEKNPEEGLAIPPRKWLDPAFNPAFRDRPGYSRPKLRSEPFGSAAPTPDAESLIETGTEQPSSTP